MVAVPRKLDYASSRSEQDVRADVPDSRFGVASFVLCCLSVFFGFLMGYTCFLMGVLDGIVALPWIVWGVCTFVGLPLAAIAFAERRSRRRYAIAGLVINGIVGTAPLWLADAVQFIF